MHESLNDEKVAKIQNYDAEALVCLLNFKWVKYYKICIGWNGFSKNFLI